MYNLNQNMILSIIQTLKEMDVRGFDSMNRLVGLVALFENILNNPVEEKKEEKEVVVTDAV